MNILLASTMVPDSPSGVRVHYQRLAEGLRQLGHTVTVLTPGSVRPWQSRRWGVLRRLLALGGPLGQHFGAELNNCANLATALDRHAAYDVVNAQDPTTGWLLRRALGPRVPVVVTGHFNDHPGLEVVRQLGLRGWAARQAMRWHQHCLTRTEHFISISAYVRDRVGPLPPAHAQHTVVHNGLDLAHFAAACPDAGLLAQAAGRPVLLNVGYLEKRKNQLFMLEVAQALRALGTPFVLGLVGQGPDEAMLRARIVAAGLQDCVWLLGHRTNVAPLLRASTLYMHAATHENFPLALLEAMACGVPTLALSVGGVPEVLGHHPTALFDPAATPVAVAQRLHHLLTTPAARSALQAYQRTQVAQFDLPVMLAGTVAAYEAACARPAHAGATPGPADFCEVAANVYAV